jgi:phenylacetate-CoA ligase
VARRALSETQLPFLPLNRVLEIQRRNVRAIVRHAYGNVPFYREAMARLKLTPEDFQSAGDLAKLPLIDSHEYLRDPARFRAVAGVRGPVLRISSSGTTGASKEFDFDARALFVSLAQGQRQRRVLGKFTSRPHGYREMVMVRDGSVSVQIRAFYERYSWMPRRVDLKRKILPPGELPLEREVEEINAFAPEVLIGYGSHLGALFRRAHARGLKLLPPRAVVYGADSMAAADRELIEREFGAPVFSIYQSAEALRIGFQCELRRGFHLSLDATAVRVIDESGRDAGPGGRGQAVISNLTNYATVLLNYRLGDVVTLGSEPCPCGRTLPVIESIEGRADDLLHLADGRLVHALHVMRKLRMAAGLDRMQMVQLGPAEFVIRVAPAEEDPTRAAALAAAVDELAGYPCRTRVEWVEKLVPERNGKTRIVISHWKPEETAGGR